MPRFAVPFLVLFLVGPAARAQDMPLFTFLPAESRWAQVDGAGKPPAAEPPPAVADFRASAWARSPDGGTLFLGRPDAEAVWAFRADAAGKPTAGAPYCPLRVRKGEKGIAVTGLTVDAAGRIYAATPEGIQVFDPTGRLSGVLAPPAKGTPARLGWDGENRDRLAVWVEGVKYARPMLARGAK